MKATSFLISLGFIASTYGANISWLGSASPITGSSDINQQGTYFGSWAPNNASSNSFPVAGVVFHGFSDLASLNNDLIDGGQYFGNESMDTSTVDNANYQNLLSWGRYGNATNHQFSWGGMTPGNTYLIQVWVGDVRTLSEARQQTLSGGSDLSPVMRFPSDGSGNGQYVIGTFVADGTGTQTITIDPSTTTDPNGGSAQINLFLVRDLGVVPEPAALGLAGLGLAGAFLRRRRC